MPERDPDRRGGVETIERTRPRVQKPRMYKVLLHNDDYTPMDFVVFVLENLFNKTHAEAVHVMLNVHRKGFGIAGIYTHEIAESKVQRVTDLAKANEHPLKCSMEPE